MSPSWGSIIATDRAPYEDRLLDLARRLLEGEAIDWAAEGIEESEVREGMKRLDKIVGRRPGGETETADEPPPEPPKPPPPPPPPRSREDKYIGDFRLVRKLGEGGMGVVYEAEQQHPRRPVALKVIRGGAHVSQDTLKLFQRESSTLARLRHPGIAALYETGATEDGLHYFAMELVRGSTLSAWLGKRPAGPISPGELKLRLSVFKKICDAVAYAHQRGVIHRDLKPANVLVPKSAESASMQDAVPDVKILDFGLARMTDSDVQATTYVTEMGKVQGTLPYMSPEQVRGNPDEIDLRTDVYSLGVILYQTVTGKMPYDVSNAQIPEAVRIICEESPKSISTTFSGTRRLDADVITIAGKCLEKEASRRYQSAAALGEDIQRYLTDQPILARPPSATYQLRKLVARHRAAFGFAATVFVLVSTLAVTSTVQAVRIAKERDRANQEAETAKQVSEFLEGLFKVSDPSEARGKTITAREILDAGAERITQELRDEPRIRARLLSVIGRTYLGLYLSDPARKVLQESLAIHESTFGPNSLEFAKALNEVGGVEQIASNPAKALEFHRRAAEIYRTVLPEDDLVRLKGEWFMANLLGMSGDPKGALPFLERGVRLLERTENPDEQLLSQYLSDLSVTLTTLGDLERARGSMERALQIQRRLFGPTHPEYLKTLNNLGWLLTLLGDTRAARPLLEEAVRRLEVVHGPRNGLTANALHSLGELEFAEGRSDEAAVLLERALSIFEEQIGPGTEPVAFTSTSLARVRLAQQRYAEAQRLLERAIEIVTLASGADSPPLADPLEVLASVHRRQGDSDEAERIERRAREIRARSGVRGPSASISGPPPSD